MRGSPRRGRRAIARRSSRRDNAGVDGWRTVGERALLREIAGADLARANASARRLAARIAALRLDDVEDVVPGARSVLVVLKPGRTPDRLAAATFEKDEITADEPARRHTIAVRYGGEHGPDLAALAALKGMSEAELVERHSRADYLVAFLGFAPGFAYLLGLPAELATPRLATPRTRVPAGSVGIGGGYSGIYPSATPGGWHLIGRTDAVLFDLERDPPALLAAGDRVRFAPR